MRRSGKVILYTVIIVGICGVFFIWNAGLALPAMGEDVKPRLANDVEDQSMGIASNRELSPDQTPVYVAKVSAMASAETETATPAETEATNVHNATDTENTQAGEKMETTTTKTDTTPEKTSSETQQPVASTQPAGDSDQKQLPRSNTADLERGRALPGDILVLVNKKHSLPADYVPQDLVQPEVPFTFKETHEKKLLRQVAAQALEQLFRKAKEDGIVLYAISGYRSYGLQQSIFNSNVSRYGLEEANQFSARPGQSEHQTGLAMDVSCAAMGYRLIESFGDAVEGQWLQQNAADYGFIIRYPKGKESITGYQYEPWHLRYVGQAVAKEIAAKKITLEEYMGTL